MRTIKDILLTKGKVFYETSGGQGVAFDINTVKECMMEAAKEVLQWVCENVEAQEEIIHDPVVGDYYEHTILRGDVMEALKHLK